MKPIKRVPAILVLGLFFFSSAARADWEPAKRLTWTSGNCFFPRIAADSSGNLHLVWYIGASGDENVFYRKSTNAGTSWSARKRLSYSSGLSQDPDIAVDSSDALHVVWCNSGPGNYEVYHKWSTDGGDSWSSSRRVTWTSTLSRSPTLAADAEAVLHLFWEDFASGNCDLFTKKSMEGSDTWSTARRLTWNSGSSQYPAIAAGPSNGLHLVWVDDTAGAFEVFYKRSTDGGVVWSTAQGLAWSTSDATRPDIVADPSGGIHVVGCDDDLWNREVFYKKSTNGGISWSINKRLSWTADDSYPPAIFLDSSANLHVVWADSTPGNMEIYYKKSTDGGVTWTANRRLTWSSGSSLYPDIAVDSSGVCHVVWYDSAPGNYEVFYRRGN